MSPTASRSTDRHRKLAHQPGHGLMGQFHCGAPGTGSCAAFTSLQVLTLLTEPLPHAATGPLPTSSSSAASLTSEAEAPSSALHLLHQSFGMADGRSSLPSFPFVHLKSEQRGKVEVAQEQRNVCISRMSLKGSSFENVAAASKDKLSGQMLNCLS